MSTTSISGGGDHNLKVYGHVTALGGSGVIHQMAVGGHDTIHLGSGHDTIFEQGSASVYGSFGSATIGGGQFKVSHHGAVANEHALGGSATLMGGTGTTFMKGGLGHDTFVRGSGHETMMGGSAHNPFEFITSGAGGQHVITNFVHGQDKLYLEGHSLAYLQSHGDITHSGGNTLISLDGGTTKIELTGVTSLSVTTHK